MLNRKGESDMKALSKIDQVAKSNNNQLDILLRELGKQTPKIVLTQLIQPTQPATSSKNQY